jgi:hypothetical protein
MPALQRLKLRAFLFLGYLITSSLGIATFILPSATYRSQGGFVLTLIWSSMLVIGGLSCAVDIVAGKWWPEMAGLMLLLAAIFSFALAVILRPNSTIPYSGFLLLPLCLMYLNRFQEIRRMRSQSRTEVR